MPGLGEQRTARPQHDAEAAASEGRAAAMSDLWPLLLVLLLLLLFPLLYDLVQWLFGRGGR